MLAAGVQKCNVPNTTTFDQLCCAANTCKTFDENKEIGPDLTKCIDLIALCCVANFADKPIVGVQYIYWYINSVVHFH